MQVPASILNQRFIQSLDDPGQKRKIAQAGTTWIRDQLREDRYSGQVIPIEPITPNDCQVSTNHDTFPICEELGLQWTSTAVSGSYKPDIFACWAGGWPFPYHPSRRNKLVPGDLDLNEMPLANGIYTRCDNNACLKDWLFQQRQKTDPGYSVQTY